VKLCSVNVEVALCVATVLRCAYVRSGAHPSVVWFINQLTHAVIAQQPCLVSYRKTLNIITLFYRNIALKLRGVYFIIDLAIFYRFILD